MIETTIVESTIVTTLSLNLILAFTALTSLWAFLRWLDWLSGGKFRDVVAPIIRKDPLASGLYYGARVIAAAILLAPIFGAVRF